MICSAIGSYITMKIGGYPVKELSPKQRLNVGLFSILFCSNILVGNTSLRFVTVSLTQVVRCIIPGLTMFLSMMILGKSYSREYLASVIFVMMGVGLASYGEVDFHVVGFLLTIFVCFLSSLKSVLSNMFLEKEDHPFDLLYRMSTLACIQLVFAAALFGEFGKIGQWREEHPEIEPSRFFFFAIINGLIAFSVNFSNFQTTKKTSALTVTVAGNVKHMATIVFSILVFSTPITLLNGLGTMVTVAGAAYYSYLERRKKVVGPTNHNNITNNNNNILAAISPGSPSSRILV